MAKSPSEISKAARYALMIDDDAEGSWEDQMPEDVRYVRIIAHELRAVRRLLAIFVVAMASPEEDTDGPG